MRFPVLEVSYAQVAVFQSPLQQPFNDWTDSHVRQGFAWRPGSVSFATLGEAGQMEVEVLRQAFGPEHSNADRIIVVPFEVDAAGDVEVASISDGKLISLPPGNYRLTFEHGLKADGMMWCRFWFEATSVAVVPEIVRADEALAPVGQLLMEARPASAC
jgi:hypothetical protein